MEQKKNKRCALYCRISTADKQDTRSQIESLTAQAKRDGFKTDNIIVYAEALSGFKRQADRPKLNELITLIEADPKYYDVVYLQELSRISRNPREISDLFNLFTDLKQQVYIKSNNLYLLNDKGEKSMVAGILISILSELGKEEARVFKERSSRGLLTSAKSGKAGGGASIAYGYKKDEKGMLVVDKEEGEVIKQIFKMYLDGYGQKLISNILNDKGIKTRYAKTHADTVIKFKGVQKKGSQVFFSDVVIGSILKNSLYCGQRKFKGEILQAPAIVSKEDFDRAEVLMEAKRRDPSVEGHPYLLKRVDLVCGVCGRRMFGRFKPVKGGDNIYVCSSRYTHERNCGNVSMNIDYIENVLLQLTMNSSSFAEQATDKASKKEKVLSSIRMSNDRISLAKNQLKAKNLEYTRIKSMYVEEIIDLKELKTMNAKLKKDIENLEASIKYLGQELVSNTNQLKRLDKPVDGKQIMKMKNDRTFLRTYFESMFKKIIINGVTKKDIIIQLTPSNESGEAYLMLDKTALLSRYGGDFKWWLKPTANGISAKYKNNILISDGEKVVNEIKKLGKLNRLAKAEMISIRTAVA